MPTESLLFKELDRLARYVGGIPMEDVWQLQDAKNKFSEVVKRAQNVGPQVVTKRGQEAVVVISAQEYRRMKKPNKNIVEFFADSPLKSVSDKLDLERFKDQPRDIEL